MSNETLTAGQVVILKSGSSRKTIVAIHRTEQSADCIWEVNGEIKREWFPLAVLISPPKHVPNIPVEINSY